MVVFFTPFPEFWGNLTTQCPNIFKYAFVYITNKSFNLQLQPYTHNSYMPVSYRCSQIMILPPFQTIQVLLFLLPNPRHPTQTMSSVHIASEGSKRQLQRGTSPSARNNPAGSSGRLLPPRPRMSTTRGCRYDTPRAVCCNESIN